MREQLAPAVATSWNIQLYRIHVMQYSEYNRAVTRLGCYLKPERPGVEPATVKSHVQRRNQRTVSCYLQSNTRVVR